MRLHRSAAGAVASTLRLRADVTGYFVDNEFWLRGDALDEALDRALQRLAPVTRFTLSGDDELIRLGNLLPERRLPSARWLPLTDLLHADRPTAALPGNLPARAGISMVRSDQERLPAMLMIPLSSWAAYAESASAARLRRLRFAATFDRALIAGNPLPPLEGTRLWERGGIIVPCGFDLSPPIDPATLRRALALTADDAALFHEDGNWELIPAGAFVSARRSAVRLTAPRQSEATP